MIVKLLISGYVRHKVSLMFFIFKKLFKVNSGKGHQWGVKVVFFSNIRLDRKSGSSHDSVISRKCDLTVHKPLSNGVETVVKPIKLKRKSYSSADQVKSEKKPKEDEKVR